MLAGLFSSLNALDAFQLALDTSANNLANVGTTAFKGSRTLFEDLLSSGPTNQQVGHGMRVSAVDRLFTQGRIVLTDSELDVAIQGEGFFAIQMPNGSTQYTRDGAFHLNANRQMVNADGFVVQPPLTFPADTTEIMISATGLVTVLTTSSPMTPVTVGQLRLTKFVNPQGLRAEPGNRFSETPASGPPTVNLPGVSGLGTIQQKSLEQSNVDTTTELLRLTNTSRSFVANSRAIRAEDQLLQSALDIVV